MFRTVALAGHAQGCAPELGVHSQRCFPELNLLRSMFFEYAQGCRNLPGLKAAPCVNKSRSRLLLLAQVDTRDHHSQDPGPCPAVRESFPPTHKHLFTHDLCRVVQVDSEFYI